MHHALLIDEIVRSIFAFALENDRSSLIVAARSCIAWRDPALDFLWRRVPSFAPLLLLIPGSSVVNGEYKRETSAAGPDLSRFNFYARRIKHISNRQELRIRPDSNIATSFDSNHTPLLNLSTAYFAIPKCAAQLIPFHFSENLVRLEVDLGFKASSLSGNEILCQYLEQTAKSSYTLRHLSLRGHASTQLNKAVANLCLLDSISLKLGTTLLPKTMKAIMDFPYLSEFEIHAGHIEFSNIYDDDDDENFVILPSLRKLHIRARAALIEILLQHLPTNVLQNIRIELDDISPCTTFWNVCFASIANKTSNTLTHLSLEHCFEIPEPIASSPLEVVPATATTDTSSETSQVSFHTLEALRNLKHIRHFSCDITIPPAVTDLHLEKIVSWWPHLQHFALESSFHPSEIEKHHPQITVACLAVFANRLADLQKLILPLVIDGVPDLSVNDARPVIQNKLQSLTVADLRAEAPFEVAQYLHHLFPSLVNLDGPCDESKALTETIDALRNFSR